MFKTATDSLGLNGMTVHQTRHSAASIDRERGFRTLQEVQRRGQWSSVTRYDKSRRLAADYHSLPRLRNKLETLAQRAEVFLTKATESPAAHRRMTGKYMIDVFGGSGFLTKVTNQLGLRGYVLDTKLGARYDVTQPIVLTRIRQDVSLGNCVVGVSSLP